MGTFTDKLYEREKANDPTLAMLNDNREHILAPLVEIFGDINISDFEIKKLQRGYGQSTFSTIEESLREIQAAVSTLTRELGKEYTEKLMGVKLSDDASKPFNFETEIEFTPFEVYFKGETVRIRGFAYYAGDAFIKSKLYDERRGVGFSHLRKHDIEDIAARLDRIEKQTSQPSAEAAPSSCCKCPHQRSESTVTEAKGTELWQRGVEDTFWSFFYRGGIPLDAEETTSSLRAQVTSRLMEVSGTYNQNFRFVTGYWNQQYGSITGLFISG